ncbi:MAG: DUF1972 domain-containing protein [Planctomycetes bacterium]|nr:DUF1972 domain-containing protein [Planctomycetota bacterium]
MQAWSSTTKNPYVTQVPVRESGSTASVSWGTIVAVRTDAGADDARGWSRALTDLANLGTRLVVIHPGRLLPAEERSAIECQAFPLLRKRLQGKVRARITRRFVRSFVRLHGACAVLAPKDVDPVVRRAARREGLRLVHPDAVVDRLDELKHVAALRHAKRRAQQRPIRISFFGTRGVPATYSGFETFVEELGSRLAVHDAYDVTVYNRRHHCGNVGASYRGMRIVTQRAIATKHLDTITHTARSVWHALRRRPDVAVMCGVGNAFFAAMLRMLGVHVIFNVDGSDWKRDKWGTWAKRYLRFCEKLAARSADVLIADARTVRDHYQETWGVHAPYVAYGGGLEHTDAHDVLDEFELESKRYVLFVGRLVPENGAHRLIEAFRRVDTDMQLVIVGDAPYSEEYKERLYDLGDGRIVFTGYQFGEAYRQLSSHAFLYVLASNVGGTHPVLVEQMSLGNTVIAHDTPANVEVLGDAGFIYGGEGRDEGVSALADALARFIEHPEITIELGERARKRAEERYSWRAVTDDYRRIIGRLVGDPLD